ncbi:MAG: T9SS type A sorting domain-containing protein [candidate division WOR-3 bacterium]|nr:MAG: T9SS type A sorting domain-containing protein [candidate division WOR-3 bacterium]
MIRTDANGDTLWTRTYGGQEGDYGWSVAECSSGGFIVTGWTETSALGGQDVYIVRTDADGNALWTKNYGGYAYDAGYSVIECATGGYVIAGEKWLYDTQWHMDIYLIRIDGNGDTLWTKNYGGANNERAYSIQECESGGFIITGWTDSYGNGDADVYLMRLDSEGAIEEGSQTQVSKSLFIHPNPSSGRAIVRYELPERAYVSLMLYDNSGRLAKVLYTGTQGEGYHEVPVYRDGLNAGVYFVRINTEGSESIRKVVLTK